MANSINMLTTQLREIWRQFGAPQRFNVIMSLMIAVGVIGGLLYWGARPDFRILYSNLSLEDASRMREKLTENKVPVQLGQSGMSISVPSSKLYEARLMLASEGLPQDSTTGFELFEQPKFGLTDFAQKVNYQRALQGELERTISSMQGIRGARVMLVMPKETLFSSEAERQAQASVMLTLQGAIAVGDSQVQSIVHLLASSVQNLDPNSVTVTDQSGRLLTRSHSGDTAMEHGNEQLDVQERTEQRLVEKAQSILDRALGVGNSIVRVSVNLDFSDMEVRDEQFDSENRVATSERIISEDKSVGGGGGGKAGVVANVSVGNPSDMKVDSGGNKDKSEELYTEYVVPSSVSVTRQKGIRIEHLTVAVCLAQQGEKARTEQEISAISSLLSSALGVSISRKDSINVTEMPFVAPEMPAEPQWWENLPVSYDSIFKGMGGLVALCAVFGASKKVKNVLLASTPSLDTPVNEARQHEQEHIMRDEPFELEDQIEQMVELAREDPKTVAAWISQAADWNSIEERS